MGLMKKSVRTQPTLLIHDEKDIAKKWIKEIKDELANLLEPRIEIDVRSIFDREQLRQSCYKNVVFFFTEEAELKDKHIHDWLEATGFQDQDDKYLVIYGTSATPSMLDVKTNVIRSHSFENVSAWWEMLFLFLCSGSQKREGLDKPQTLQLEIFAADSEYVKYTKQQVSDFCTRYGITQNDDANPTMKLLLVDQGTEWLTEEKKNELLERRIRHQKTAAIVMRGFEIVSRISPIVPDQVIRFKKLHLTLLLLVGFGIVKGKLRPVGMGSPGVELTYSVKKDRNKYKQLSLKWTSSAQRTTESRNQSVLKVDVMRSDKWVNNRIVDLNKETDSFNIDYDLDIPCLRLTTATEAGIHTEYSVWGCTKQLRQFFDLLHKVWCPLVVLCAFNPVLLVYLLNPLTWLLLLYCHDVDTGGFRKGSAVIIMTQMLAVVAIVVYIFRDDIYDNIALMGPMVI